MMCCTVFGATTTFDNAGGGGNGNWNTATNWTGTPEERIPVAGDTVIIAANCTLDIATTPLLVSITINTAVTLNNTTATSLNATTITCGGSGKLTQTVNNGTITGNLIGAGSADLITVAGSINLTVVGDITSTSVSSGADTVYFNSSGTLTVTGNVTGGDAGSTNTGITAFDTSAKVIVNGTVTGGGGHSGNYGVDFNASSVADAFTGSDLNFVSGKAMPLGGFIKTITITGASSNGTAIGGSGGGYRGRYAN
jgi:hypothetical protein